MAIPHNIETIEDTRMIGIAGLMFLGESSEEPTAYFSDSRGNSLSVYSDGSVWLCTNVSKVYPSVGDYLADCVGNDDSLTAQLREWAN